MINKRPKRDKKEKILKQEFQSSELPNNRIQPHGRYFGNTRVVGQKELEVFREELQHHRSSNYNVILKERKLPMSLLNDHQKQARYHFLDTQPFEDAFGPKTTRKHLKLLAPNYESLLQNADSFRDKFEQKNIGTPAQGNEGDGFRDLARDTMFEKGQSKPIWGELYKVIDSLDVIVQVLDARDPQGTRCYHLENHLKENCKHKHMIILLNKCDLVPAWVTKGWLRVLFKEFPTLAYHASINKSFGKGSLLSILRQFSRLKSDKQAISVGFVGYPNVGKSTVINTLRTKNVMSAKLLQFQERLKCGSITLTKRIFLIDCPGVVYQNNNDTDTDIVLKGVVRVTNRSAKLLQFQERLKCGSITLTKRIFLIDCPGVVYQNNNDTDTDIVLKGVVRVTNLPDAAEHIGEVIRRVKKEHLERAYKIEHWEDDNDFLVQLCKLSGKLLKGGEPDLMTAAKMVLHDWQKGKIPFFVVPPRNDEDFSEEHTDKLENFVDENQAPADSNSITDVTFSQRPNDVPGPI